MKHKQVIQKKDANDASATKNKNKSIKRSQKTQNVRQTGHKTQKRIGTRFLKKNNTKSTITSPRETIIANVLDRDRLYSVALPPVLKKEKIKIIKF